MAKEDKAHSGDMGMTEGQEDLIAIAVRKFKSTTFTAGMLCEVSDNSASDCVKMLDELHAIGVVRCPVNDGGSILYEVMPEMVYRAKR